MSGFVETRGRKSKEPHSPPERPEIDANRHLPFVEWAPKFLKIRDTNGVLVPFKLQPIQLRINALWEQQLKEQGSVRLVILKPRRVQASSIVQGRMFRSILENGGWHAGVLAHEEQSLQIIFDRARTFHSELPPEMQREIIRWNKKELTYRDPHAAFFKVNVSKGRGGFGRGGDFQLIHFSEAAHYQKRKGLSKAEGQMAGIIGSLPRVPGSVCVIESTAAGVGNEFHEYYTKAKKKQNGFEAVFFGWHEFPDHRLPGKKPADFYSAPEWEAEEGRLRDMGIDDEQLAWRRWKIADLGADLDTFHQEEPVNDEEAFLSSGSPVFWNSLLHIRSDELRRREENHPTLVYSLDSAMNLKEDKYGNLRFWRTRGHGDQERNQPDRIVITADPSGSGTSAVSSADKVKGDPACAHVWDRRHDEQIAELHGYFAPEEFAEQLNALSKFYGGCLVVPEGGPWGGHVISHLQKLGTNLYFREAIGENEQVLRTDWTRYGWLTTAKTKPQMIDALRDMHNTRKIIINSPETISEHLTFVKKGTAREAALGCHDDRVICCAIYALWCFQHPWTEKEIHKYEPPKPKSLGEMLKEWIKEAEADKSKRRAKLWQL